MYSTLTIIEYRKDGVSVEKSRFRCTMEQVLIAAHEQITALAFEAAQTREPVLVNPDEIVIRILRPVQE